MSPTEESVKAPNPAAAAHAPRQAAPVMDVTPPPATEAPIDAPSAPADPEFIATPITREAPVMPAPPAQDEPEPVAEQQTDNTPSAPPEESKGTQSKAVGKEIQRANDAKAHEQAVKKPAKQGNNSVVVAVVATVIVVLSLSILAVLAYKSSK